MLGKSDIPCATEFNALREYQLIIPLNFWFSRHINMSLPLISMLSQDIKINFSLKNFDELINFNGNPPTSSVNIIDSDFFVEYIYVDDKIVEKLKLQPQTYVIEQVQYNNDIAINANITDSLIKLDFTNPVKEIIFGCVSDSSINTNNYFNYSDENETSFIENIYLLIDGRKRFDNIPEFYFRTTVPDLLHTIIPLKYIYYISFSLKPEDHIQPLGSINTSRFDDILLSLKLVNNHSSCRIFIYAISYNILKFENGYAYLEFS